MNEDRTHYLNRMFLTYIYYVKIIWGYLQRTFILQSEKIINLHIKKKKNGATVKYNKIQQITTKCTIYKIMNEMVINN